MPTKNLKQFLNLLEQKGELVRVKEFVDPILEITEVVDRVSKTVGQNKAILFENTGTDFPLVINMLGSERRMAYALDVDEIDYARVEIQNLMSELMKPQEGMMNQLKMLPKLGKLANWMPKVVHTRNAACQQVIMKEPDLHQLPVLKCWPADGGRFLTLPIVHTKDPRSGMRNIGLYRVQVFEKDLTGMHWHKHKVSASHFNAYREMGLKMPVAIVLGGDPLYTYSATAPLPPNVDEYVLTGFLRKEKVKLVPCVSQPEIQVPIDADFVIEGYIDPTEDFILEGPFGDHTGYYSLADYYPKFHVTAITHRKDAIYPATIVGIPPQEDAWIGKATERIFLAPIKMTLIPEILDMDLPIEGVFHNLTIVKIKKEYAGQAQKVMNAMWGAGQMMFNKILVVVDENVEVTDYEQVAQQLKYVDPEYDIILGTGPMDVLDHSCSAFSFGGKMGIDATKKLPEELQHRSGTPPIVSYHNLDFVLEQFPSITQIDSSLMQAQIPIVTIAIEKNQSKQAKILGEQLFALPEFSEVKMLLVVDDLFSVSDLADVVWRLTNNMDAKRDTYIIPSEKEGQISRVVLDGTRKTKKYDNFNRDWPNIITSDSSTIERVDKIWDQLGLGPFIESPSLKYREQQYSGGAVAPEE